MTQRRTPGPGRLWKRGSTWVLDFHDEFGKRRSKVLGPNKRRAQELQVELIARRNRILLGLELGPNTVALDELREVYLRDLATRVTAMHVRNVELQLDIVLAAIPARTVGEVRPLDLVEYRNKLIADDLSNRTANVHVQALRGMLNWAVQVELISRNPLASLRKLPEGKRHQKLKRRALTEAEIESVILVADAEDEEQGRRARRIPQRVMWQFLLESGVRYGEMRSVLWEDLDEERAIIRLHADETKSGKDRVIPLRRELLREIQDLRAHQWRVNGLRPKPGDHVFVQPRGRPWSRPSNNALRTLRRLLEKAGIPAVDARGFQVDVHGVRHTAATRLARNGVPIAMTQKILGHSDVRTTAAIYTHIEVEDLRGAVETLGERQAKQAGNPKAKTAER